MYNSICIDIHMFTVIALISLAVSGIKVLDMLITWSTNQQAVLTTNFGSSPSYWVMRFQLVHYIAGCTPKSTGLL